jgi:valyl-tRNA synthetase
MTQKFAPQPKRLAYLVSLAVLSLAAAPQLHAQTAGLAAQYGGDISRMNLGERGRQQELQQMTEAQKAQLEKDLQYFVGFLQSVEKKLSNENFVQNAKPDVLAIEQKKKADALARIQTIEESLAQL